MSIVSMFLIGNMYKGWGGGSNLFGSKLLASVLVEHLVDAFSLI